MSAVNPEQNAHMPHSPEVESEHFNVAAEYANERMTFCGVEGTLDELKRKCPFADKLNDGSISLQEQNDFAVRMMNASGATVKAEHVPYFTERLTELGQEVKFKVEVGPAPEQAEAIKNEETNARKPKPEAEKHQAREKVKVEPEQPTVSNEGAPFQSLTQEKVHAKEPDSTAESVAVGGDRAEESSDRVDLDSTPRTTEEVQSVPESAKEVTIQEWMDGLEAEYEALQATHRQAIEAPIDEPAETSLYKAVAQTAETLAPATVAESSAATEESLTADDHIETQPFQEETPDEVGIAISEDQKVPSENMSKITQEDDSDLASEVAEGDSIRRATVAEGTALEVDESIQSAEHVVALAPLDSAQEEEGVELMLPQSLSELFAEGESFTPPDEVGAEQSQEREYTLNEDKDFIAQIEAYIIQFEASEVAGISELGAFVGEAEYSEEGIEIAPLPRHAFVEVLETAQQVQQIQAKIETITAIEIDGENTPAQEQLAEMQEQKEALEAELYEVCEQFLESIGVELTEKKVQALVDRVLKINFEALKKEQQFTIEQLASMGTHEYKVGDWFQQKTKQAFSLAGLSTHKIIGIFALQHIAVDRA